MKKILFIILFAFTFVGAKAQEVSCEDLKNYIEKEGRYYSSISSYTLNSSWLYKVTCYSYDMKYYVVAEIKANEYSYQTKSYVFCGISFSDWYDFSNGKGYNDKRTYGERFHDYIMDYQCNCY
jgi:hypothetical protein